MADPVDEKISDLEVAASVSRTAAWIPVSVDLETFPDTKRVTPETIANAVQLGDVSDVQFTNPTTNQALVYISGTWVNSGVGITVEEADGSPSVSNVRKLVVSNGSLTDSGSGTVTLQTGGSDDGWIATTESFAYSSPGSTGLNYVKALGDFRTKYSKGMRFNGAQSHSPIVYYPLDSNSNDSVSSLNGTDTNITYSAGKFSNGASFNGTTSKIVFTDGIQFRPTGEFTLGMWIKTSTTGATQQLFQSYSANTSRAGISLQISTANVIKILVGKNTGTTAGVDYTEISGAITVTDNTFHYVVVSFRNNFIQVYVDGKLDISGYCLTPAYAATNYVRLGCQNTAGTDGNFFTGIIDDVFLMNGYALNEKTIKDKYDTATAQGASSFDVTKNFIVNDVYYSGGYTYLGMDGGTDFSLANSTLSSQHFSSQKAPYGFNLNPNKWSVLVVNVVDYTKTSPAAGTWYNAVDSSQNLPSITLPIGCWNLFYKCVCRAEAPATDGYVRGQTTLSTTTSSETDVEFSATNSINPGPTSGNNFVLNQYIPSIVKTVVTYASTAYYLLVSTANPASVSLKILGGTGGATYIKATNAYL